MIVKMTAKAYFNGLFFDVGRTYDISESEADVLAGSFIVIKETEKTVHVKDFKAPQDKMMRKGKTK